MNPGTSKTHVHLQKKADSKHAAWSKHHRGRDPLTLAGSAGDSMPGQVLPLATVLRGGSGHFISLLETEPSILRIICSHSGKSQEDKKSEGQIDGLPWHRRDTEAGGNLNEHEIEQDESQTLVRGPESQLRQKGPWLSQLTDPNVVGPPQLSGVSDSNE